MIDKTTRDIMQGMINILNEASERYYNTDNPMLTDEQFDARLNDLRELEEETGVIFSNSPTQNVGAKILSELPKAEHNHLMLSLEKCHTVDELIKFANNKELVASIKLDGLTVSIKYENGVLVSAETRGDGYVGVDITEHIKRFKNVPLRISKDGVYVIDGEAIITDDDFAEINKDNEFKNSRNLASGTLSVLDTSLVSERKLRFVAWDIIYGGSSNNLINNLDEAEELGFDVVPHWSAVNLNPKKLQSTLDYIFDYAKEDGLPCDGIVFKFNDIEYGKSLGNTWHHFNNAIAYKAQDDVYETELIDIEWQVGKTGVITPVAVFKSVEISGSMVEKASLHNISILEDLDLCIGDKIEVYKANMVIPQVKRNISAEQRQYVEVLEAPTITKTDYCPICHSETKIIQDNNSKILVCTNDDCKGKLLGKLAHFVSKNAMNIDGLSEATLEKFINLDWLTKFIDIYYLDVNKEEMIKLEGFGKKSVNKLMAAIENSRNTTLDRFIYALSIPLVGRETAKLIAKDCEYDIRIFLERFCSTSYDWDNIDGIGYMVRDSINDYAFDDMNMVIELSDCMEFTNPTSVNSNSSISGLTFVITGSLNKFTNRDELKEKIESLGGKATASVTKKTDYLINNDINSSSSKNQKAKSLGVPIITEGEFINMIN